MSDIIYLDNNSTTPIDPSVLETMMPFFTTEYANASSNHSFGHEVKDFTKTAREQIASLIHCEAREIVFTSGATEAINLAIKGAADSYQINGKHIITCLAEHTATLDVCKFLETRGYEVTYLPINREGLIDLDKLKEELRSDTLMVSIMLANNETGVIQPIKEIGKLAHEAGALLMTDATQAFGKMPINVDDLGIDLMAFSGHKIYGPKGIGGLFVRQRRPNRVKISPLIHGGGHEKGMRSGTSNVPGMVGLGKAAQIASTEMLSDAKRIGDLRDKLESKLLQIPDTFVNGHLESRLYNVSSLCFKGANADAIMIGLKTIMVSNGSACTSTKIEASHVLMAMGLKEEEAYATLRISLGRFTTEEDIVTAIDEIESIVKYIRQM